MVSAAGRENFRNQLTQLVGSIQMTNGEFAFLLCFLST